MNGFLNQLRWYLRWDRTRITVLLLGVVLFTAAFMGVSDLFKPEDIKDMMDRMPKFLRSLAGHQVERTLTPEFWVMSIASHPIWQLLMLTFPVAAGLRSIGGLRNDGTLEWTLSQPVSRSQTYAAAVVFLLGCSTLISLAAGLALWASGRIWFPGEVSNRIVVESTVSVWSLLCAVSMLALTLGASFRRPGPWILGILIVMAAWYAISPLWSVADRLGWLSIFYCHHPRLIHNEGFVVARFIIGMAWTVALAVLGWWRFTRRDVEG